MAPLDSLSFLFVRLLALVHPLGFPMWLDRKTDGPNGWIDRDALPLAVNLDSHEPERIHLGLVMFTGGMCVLSSDSNRCLAFFCRVKFIKRDFLALPDTQLVVLISLSGQSNI